MMKPCYFNYYRRDDNGFYPVAEKDMPQANAMGDDIYWTPQEFSGFGKRKKEDLVAIRFVCADFDKITKKDLLYKIKYLPRPSFIISTRSGFHIYWHLLEELPPTPENIERYSNLIKNKLVPLGADPQAVDVSRILRVPLMRYWRDSKGNVYNKEAIHCDIVDESDKRYSFDDLEELIFSPPIKKKVIDTPSVAKTGSKHGGADLWTKANNLPVREALEKLSGTPYVSMEQFTFKQQGKITRIHIGNKPSNAWIDQDGKIGSTVGAAPKIPNWLFYYHKDWKKVAEIMKEVFGL